VAKHIKMPSVNVTPTLLYSTKFNSRDQLENN
jgi:hypothetical protein